MAEAFIPLKLDSPGYIGDSAYQLSVQEFPDSSQCQCQRSRNHNDISQCQQIKFLFPGEPIRSYDSPCKAAMKTEAAVPYCKHFQRLLEIIRHIIENNVK